MYILATGQKMDREREMSFFSIANTDMPRNTLRAFQTDKPPSGHFVPHLTPIKMELHYLI